MSKKILFLKTLLQYLFLYIRNASPFSLNFFNLISRSNPIFLGIFILFILIFLSFSTLLYMFFVFCLMALKLFLGFLETYIVFVLLRLLIEWFPAVNPYDYKALTIVFNLIDPFFEFIDIIIPKIKGLSIGSIFSYLLLQQFIEILSSLIGEYPGDNTTVGKILLVVRIPTFFDFENALDLTIRRMV